MKQQDINIFDFTFVYILYQKTENKTQIFIIRKFLTINLHQFTINQTK